MAVHRPMLGLAMALTGCIQAVPTDAPCPCVAPALCCPALDRCVETADDCPVAPASASTLRIVSIAPDVLPAAGGLLTLILEHPIDEPAVHVGGLPCPLESVDDTRITCRARPGTSGDVLQPLRVDGVLDGRPVQALDTVRYRVPLFVDVSDAAGIDPPAGQSITVAHLFGDDPDSRDLIFARGSPRRGGQPVAANRAVALDGHQRGRPGGRAGVLGEHHPRPPRR